MASLVAYTGVGGPVPHLLQHPAQGSATGAAPLPDKQAPRSFLRTRATPMYGPVGTMQ
jgi:hypothetical protein